MLFFLSSVSSCLVVRHQLVLYFICESAIKAILLFLYSDQLLNRSFLYYKNQYCMNNCIRVHISNYQQYKFVITHQNCNKSVIIFYFYYHHAWQLWTIGVERVQRKSSSNIVLCERPPRSPRSFNDSRLLQSIDSRPH